jgi:lipid-A-disaccharide synthase-like uncharacterized protein
MDGVVFFWYGSFFGGGICFGLVYLIKKKLRCFVCCLFELFILFGSS